MPLWVAYLLFDFVFVLLVSIAVTLATWNEMPYWYAVGYLFLVLTLYGLAAILMGYIISMLAGSQLAAFAFMTGTMGMMFALTIMTFSVRDPSSSTADAC
jgi:ATP-binding cassette subfamily A (ABC1) protein 3